jgi:uncharacterized protein (DUF2249 family)/iron-sulfur cluster repair protein YtfE (RIC family)
MALEDDPSLVGRQNEEGDRVTITQTEAFEAMLAHHRALVEHVGIRMSALTGAVAAGSPHEAAAAALVAYLADEVLPHALAEEDTIYRVAGTRAELTVIVTEMVGEHRALASAVEQLANASSGPEAAQHAEAIAALFATHVAKENDILLPPLLVDDEVDLAQLLMQMHRLTEAAQETPVTEDASAPDSEAAVLSLLLEAATDLAKAGQGDRACKLVASAWAQLRVPRPELAVRVTATLHKLVRLVTAEPIVFRSIRDGRYAGSDPELDVRNPAPAQRHESIFAEYRALAFGTGFVLVNDHDPKPLRYQFEAEHPGEFTWDTLEAGPQVWRVHIGKPPAAAGAPVDAGNPPGEEELELDVRVLAHGQRHESIFAKYRALAPGTGFVLVNDHDPKPLRYQFEAEHPGEFTWNYLESGPKVWRVRIGRTTRMLVR